MRAKSATSKLTRRASDEPRNTKLFDRESESFSRVSCGVPDGVSPMALTLGFGVGVVRFSGSCNEPTSPK